MTNKQKIFLDMFDPRGSNISRNIFCLFVIPIHTDSINLEISDVQKGKCNLMEKGGQIIEKYFLGVSKSELE